MIVVDASLAAKWVLWEGDTPDALAFLHQYGEDIGAPDLIIVEVAAAIVRRANIEKGIESEALRALDQWTEELAEQIVKPHRVTPGLTNASARLAIHLGHPLKDCVYLALAIELDCMLVTCDAKFREKAVELYPQIRLLSDFDLPPRPALTEV